MQAKTSATVVVLEIIQQARWTLARSPPGTTVGGWQLMPHLKPVGHQSTNWMGRLVLMVATEALTSFGNVTTVHEAASHVLAVARVALGHHGSRLEGRVGDLGDGELLVVGLLGGDDRGVGGEHEVDARVRDKVGLEFGDVDVEGAIEAEGGGQGRDALGDEAVEVGVGRALDIEGAAADPM